MCARYTMRTRAEDLRSLFSLESIQPYEVRPHAAPTDRMPVLRVNSKGERVMEIMRWGLIPFWAKDIAAGRSTFNARSETIFEKPSFREPVLRRRCLVPADGFVEWKEVDDQQGGGLFGDELPKKARPRKVPHWIGMADRSVFAFAGVYDRWKAPDGSVLASFSIVTGPPNALLATIHDRMPVILPPTVYEVWLDRSVQSEDPIRALLQPFPADKMAVEPF